MDANGVCGFRDHNAGAFRGIVGVHVGARRRVLGGRKVHRFAGEKDRAFEWLDRALEEHCGLLAWLRFDPVWDTLREEPRFRKLLDKMNLSA